MEQRELISNVKSAIKSVDPEAKVILFGSRARGDEKQSSDWDFLILASIEPTKEYKNKITASLIDTELEAEQVISTIVYSQAEWSDYQITPLYQNISKEGIEV